MARNSAGRDSKQILLTVQGISHSLLLLLLLMMMMMMMMMD